MPPEIQPQNPQKDKGSSLQKMIIVLIAFVFLEGIFAGLLLIQLSKNQGIAPSIKNTNQYIPSKSGLSYVVPKEIRKFKNSDELKEFLAEKTSQPSYGYSRGIGALTKLSDSAPRDGIGGLTEEGLAFGAPAGLATEEFSTDYSQTNIQVAGVDEADIVKTDGKYIYALSQNNLFIVEAKPAATSQVLSKIAFKSNPQNIYVNKNSLIVLGTKYQIWDIEPYKSFRRHNEFSYLKVFDTADKKNPKLVRDLEFEGYLLNSRMIEEYVYVITSANASYYDSEPPLPRILQNGAELSQNPSADVYYFDPDGYSYNFTSVASVNVRNNDEPVQNEVYLMTGSQNLYVSKNSIFITYTKNIPEEILVWEATKEIFLPRLSAKDRERIAKIESVDGSILSLTEKFQKISPIIERYSQGLSEEEKKALEKEVLEKIRQKYEDITKELEKTVIHKINIQGPKLKYAASGEVTGYVLNQFSMDEDGEYFRIATTKNRGWSPMEEESREPYNNLYVLDGSLKVVGKLENLARTERIYSVRFMQNRAYMVTFRQIDPLFVIDLRDPKNPRALGELKIPGYSNYLHPYDEKTLIGLGKETAINEWGGATNQGLKLSLFDVSDISIPKEIDTYVFEDKYSSSLAESDHKAFLFSKEKNLLVIPVSSQTNEKDVYCSPPPAVPCTPEGPCPLIAPRCSTQYKYFRGAAVFRVDTSGFSLKGKIDHASGAAGGNDVSQKRIFDGYNYDYSAQVKRSLFIDAVLYTLSDAFLKMNTLENLEAIKTLELKKETTKSNDDFDIVN